MTTSTDPLRAGRGDADRRPAAPSSWSAENVNGIVMPVFKNRFRSLRDLLARSVQFGDAELAVWDSGPRWTFRDHERLVASRGGGAAREARHRSGQPRRDPGRELPRVGAVGLGDALASAEPSSR